MGGVRPGIRYSPVLLWLLECRPTPPTRTQPSGSSVSVRNIKVNKSYKPLLNLSCPHSFLMILIDSSAGYK